MASTSRSEPHDEPPLTTLAGRPASLARAVAVNRVGSASESSDDGVQMSPAAARRFARRNMRRTSPTPDLVTSLVRPPSPDALYTVPQLRERARQGEARARSQLGRLSGTPNGGSSPSLSAQRRTGPMLAPHLSSLDIPKHYGGNCVFDLYSLSYVAEPDPNLLCPICHDPLVDPVTTPCDHTFCYRCLRRSMDSSPSGAACPIDREPLSWLDCFSSARLIRTQLNALIVKCPYHNRGCNREMRREVIETHVGSECRFTEFLCPDTDCDKKLHRKPFDETCLHYETQCTLCDTSIQAMDRDVHLLSCPKGKTRCEACWALVCRSEMTSHHETDCEGIEVGCRYQELGCPSRMARGQMSSHAVTCAFHPETPSGAVIRTQQDIIRHHQELSHQLQEMSLRQTEHSQLIQDLSARVGNPGQRSDSIMNDNRTMQDLDAGFEEIHQNLTHLEARQSTWTLNQVMPIREEVTELRNNINMIRMHVNWLLNRSREEGRVRAANNSGSSGTGREGPSIPGPGLPERRRSSGTDTDLPRL